MQVENSPNEFSSRLRDVILAKYPSLRDFCTATGFSYGTLHQYLGGKRMPGADALLILSANLGINVHWLLTGTGVQQIEPGSLVITPSGEVVAVVQADAMMACDAPLATFETVAKVMAPQASDVRLDSALAQIAELEAELAALKRPEPKAEDYQVALEQELVKLWGIGEIALVARNGGHAYTRTLLRYLVSQYPKPITLDRLLLADLDGAHKLDVVAALAVLVRKGLVNKAGASYSVPDPDVQLSSDDMPELHQQALEAVREILTTILPITDHHRDRGRLVLSDVYVPDGKQLAREVMNAIKDVIERANDTPGPERVSFVLGLAIDTPPAPIHI